MRVLFVIKIGTIFNLRLSRNLDQAFNSPSMPLSSPPSTSRSPVNTPSSSPNSPSTKSPQPHNTPQSFSRPPATAPTAASSSYKYVCQALAYPGGLAFQFAQNARRVRRHNCSTPGRSISGSELWLGRHRFPTESLLGLERRRSAWL